MLRLGLLLVIVLGLRFGIKWARRLSNTLKEDQKNLAGGALAIIGILLFIYAVSLISYDRGIQGDIFDRLNIDGIAAIIFGTTLLIIGVIIISSKTSTLSKTTADNSVKKCPYCAEIIKAEAKICRFCKSEIKDTMTENS